MAVPQTVVACGFELRGGLVGGVASVLAGSGPRGEGGERALIDRLRQAPSLAAPADDGDAGDVEGATVAGRGPGDVLGDGRRHRRVVVVPWHVDEWDVGGELRGEAAGERDVVGAVAVREVADDEDRVDVARCRHRVDVVVARGRLEVEVAADERAHTTIQRTRHEDADGGMTSPVTTPVCGRGLHDRRTATVLVTEPKVPVR